MSRPSHFSGAYTLVSNNTYTVNGTTYQTDAKGRISSFSGKTAADSAPRSPSAQRNLPGKQPGEDAGHLMAASQGGSGRADNLIRMDHQVNVRDYRAMERENDAFMKEGKEVTLHGFISYPGESNWADSIMVTREVTDPATGATDVEHCSWTNIDMAQFEGEEDWITLADEYPNPGAEQEAAYYAELQGQTGSPAPEAAAPGAAVSEHTGAADGLAAEGVEARSDSFGPDGGVSDTSAGSADSIGSFGPDGGSAADDDGDGLGPSDSDSDGLSL